MNKSIEFAGAAATAAAPEHFPECVDEDRDDDDVVRLTPETFKKIRASMSDDEEAMSQMAEKICQMIGSSSCFLPQSAPSHHQQSPSSHHHRSQRHHRNNNTSLTMASSPSATAANKSRFHNHHQTQKWFVTANASSASATSAPSSAAMNSSANSQNSQNSPKRGGERVSNSKPRRGPSSSSSPSDSRSTEEVAMRTVMSCLNRLTDAKYDTFKKVIFEVVDSVEEVARTEFVKKVLRMILTKASMDDSFAPLYVTFMNELCVSERTTRIAVMEMLDPLDDFKDQVDSFAIKMDDAITKGGTTGSPDSPEYEAFCVATKIRKRLLGANKTRLLIYKAMCSKSTDPYVEWILKMIEDNVAKDEKNAMNWLVMDLWLDALQEAIQIIPGLEERRNSSSCSNSNMSHTDDEQQQKHQPLTYVSLMKQGRDWFRSNIFIKEKMLQSLTCIKEMPDLPPKTKFKVLDILEMCQRRRNNNSDSVSTLQQPQPPQPPQPPQQPQSKVFDMLSPSQSPSPSPSPSPRSTTTTTTTTTTITKKTRPAVAWSTALKASPATSSSQHVQKYAENFLMGSLSASSSSSGSGMHHMHHMHQSSRFASGAGVGTKNTTSKDCCKATTTMGGARSGARTSNNSSNNNNNNKSSGGGGGGGSAW